MRGFPRLVRSGVGLRRDYEASVISGVPSGRGAAGSDLGEGDG
jgi:hypothetical protein